MRSISVYVALQQFCEEDPAPRRILEGAGFQVRQNPFGRRLRREELAEVLRDADAVLAGVEPYDLSTLSALPRLRCISRCGVGTDSIDLEAARNRNVAVLTTADEVVEPAAQLTLAMILALARNLQHHARETAGVQWKKRIGFLLSEWAIGLIGFGRIGREVERLLRPFGPRILVTDPAVSPSELPQGAQARPLEALLREADLVSLHASRRPDDGPLLGGRELAAMKRGGFLVNTARGHLVDEQALVQALQSGHLAGAALDVFQEEPYAGSLLKLPQVLATPHVASLTRASRAAMELRCAQNVVSFFAQAEHPLRGRT